MTQSPSDIPFPHVDDVGRDSGTTLITRVSEARVRPERFEAFRDFIVSTVRAFPDRHPGLVSHEVLLAPPGTLLYVSRWRGEEDLVAFAGEHWRDQPVVLPGEGEYLVAPLRVRHFTPATAT
ncbi:putative quinol monooxygenase [Streptomyces massasporeus]|uniref:putative quinol monooxygenase n=1 Tax=Streptomyces massasporeus TaxID=67324 RepID=UPI00331BEE01